MAGGGVQRGSQFVTWSIDGAPWLITIRLFACVVSLIPALDPSVGELSSCSIEASRCYSGLTGSRAYVSGGDDDDDMMQGKRASISSQRSIQELPTPEVTYDNYDHIYKILIIGDSGVGKSSLLIRFADDMFSERFQSTIGVDFKLKTIHLDGKVIKLQLWDTAGQERFRTITKNTYRNADGFIVVYDITQKDSFRNVEQWLEEIEKHGKESSDRLLVGNKCDMKNDRTIDYTSAQAYSEAMGLDYVETSARNSTNVERAFMTMAANIKKRKCIEDSEDVTSSFNLKPGEPIFIRRQKKCC